MSFIVTEKAQRPASTAKECFYCGEGIGRLHKDSCVLVNKKVKVRMTIDYDVEVPASWGKEQIEFHRNEGTWCADNALEELKGVAEKEGCLCGITEFELLGQTNTAPYLDEG